MDRHWTELSSEYLGQLCPEFVLSGILRSLGGGGGGRVRLGFVLRLLRIFLGIGGLGCRLGGWLDPDGSFCRFIITCEQINFIIFLVLWFLSLRLINIKLLSQLTPEGNGANKHVLVTFRG